MNYRGSGGWEDLDASPMVAGRSFGERAVFFSRLQRAGPVDRPRQHDMSPGEVSSRSTAHQFDEGDAIDLSAGQQ